MKKLLLLFLFLPISMISQVTANDAVLTVCETNTDGFATFDLTQADSDVLNGQPASNFQVSYHISNVDAQNATNQLQSTYVGADGEMLYARVEDLGSANYATSLIFLEVGEEAIANPAQDIVVCGNQGFGTFDLTFNEPIVLGSQNPSMFYVSFYLTQSDADAEVNEIVNPLAFSNTYNPQTIYVRVTSVNSSCNAITSFEISTVDCTQNTDNDLVTNGDEDVNNNGNLNDDDTDGNNVANYLDDDDDGDGILTADEDYNDNGDPTDDDTNNNGIPDYLDAEVALAVNDFERANFSIFPNPVSDVINFRFDNGLQIEEARIYAIDGSLVRNLSEKQLSTNQFDVSELMSGIYFIQLKSGKSTIAKKLIVK